MAGERYQETSSGDAHPGQGSTTGPPRWVRIFGIIAAIVVLVIVILLLTGGHGPRRHTPSGGLGQSPVAGLPQPGV